MTNNWDHTKELFARSLEKMIADKYIVKAEYISLDGLAATLANDLRSFEKENEKLEATSQMLNTMQKYFPLMFEEALRYIRESAREPKTKE